MIRIGTLTQVQLAAINANRAALKNPAPPIEAEIVFVGRHLYNSRVVKDGYTVAEVLVQIQNALSERARFVRTLRATLIQDPTARRNSFGDSIHDEGCFGVLRKVSKAGTALGYSQRRVVSKRAKGRSGSGPSCKSEWLARVTKSFRRPSHSDQ